MVNIILRHLKISLLNSMKVNKVIALRLMLSMLMVIGFASCSKNLVQKTPLEELDGTLTVKSQAAKKQEAGPGLVFVEGGTTIR
jgi:hypothetical protein